MDNPLEGTAVTKKVGPLPIWAWALAGVVVYLVVSRFMGRGSSADSQDYQSDETDTSGMDEGGTGTVSSTGIPGTGTVAPLQSITDSLGTITDWGVAAVNWLISQGVDPLLANNAVSAFINTGTVTTAQASLISKALKGIGSPPDGSYPVVISPTGSAPKPTVPAPKPTGSKPGSVTGLKVKSADRTGAVVDWTKVPGATSYQVQVTGSAIGARNRTFSAPTSSARITGMKAGEKFQVHVAGRNGSGVGPTATIQVDLKGGTK